jgi:hypothetical protein
MSAKWRRSLAWDDRVFPAWAAPAKFVLRAFSSIWLAVCTLSLIALYGTLASVPIGMLALGPTFLFYGITILGFIAVGAGIPAAVAWITLAKRSRAAAFAGVVLALLVLTPISIFFWHRFAWPSLHYDPVSGDGVRFFASFVAAYEETTLRRLPGFEMTELEFYSWWPMQVLLLGFVANMVTATLRRIEFSFKNIGVLTVHTGIITIALGSVYYQAFKKEGDTILVAGRAVGTGEVTGGPAQRVFYDNTYLSLYVDQFRGWQQRPLSRVPRYNAYNLNAGAGEATFWTLIGRELEETGVDHELSVPVPDGRTPPNTPPLVHDDLRFEIVGYAPYAEPERDWRQAQAPIDASASNPLQIVELIFREEGVPSGEGDGRADFRFALLPSDPAHRVSGNNLITLEMTRGMDDARWADLTQRAPGGVGPMIVLETPATGERLVVPAAPEITHEIGGHRVTVTELHAEPPFPIVTEGYAGATTGVAVLRVEGPEGAVYDRWVYHAFPEISQDMLAAGPGGMGMPDRRDADVESLRIGYVPHDGLRVYIDERADGSHRAVVRGPDGSLQVYDPVPDDGVIRDAVPRIDFRLAERWAHAEAFDRPVLVPEMERQRDFIGTHDKAMFAVKLTATIRTPEGDRAWSSIRWVPFTRFLSLGSETTRRFALPDGRRVNVAVGRRQHPLPGFTLSLVDFELIRYDHRGAPRDYQSMVRVAPGGARPGQGPSFEPFEHVTKLNAPLTAPYNVHADRNPVVGFLGRLAAGLNPNQYKFAQAGWDREGWEQSQAEADAGLIDEPFAQFTILGVGNNPGIHVIALGGILMGLGIPWAFYVKPWLVRRERDRIKAQLAKE